MFGGSLAGDISFQCNLICKFLGIMEVDHKISRSVPELKLKGTRTSICYVSTFLNRNSRKREIELTLGLALVLYSRFYMFQSKLEKVLACGSLD